MSKKVYTVEGALEKIIDSISLRETLLMINEICKFKSMEYEISDSPKQSKKWKQYSDIIYNAVKKIN